VRAPATAATLPRLLAGISDEGPCALEAHQRLHGPLPPPLRSKRERTALLDEVERARLCGRGGAYFPLAQKLRAVLAAGHVRAPRYVVANGAEGDPSSAKDRTLMRLLPHLVLDGVAIAGDLIGARGAVLAIGADAHDAQSALERALQERARADEGRPRTELVTVPNRYISGQETALLRCLEGGAPLPRFASPPHQRGLRGQPTLVSNVETLAHLALIARYGADWFAQLGSGHEPGSVLVTLWGAACNPGVYEVEQGAPLGALIDAAGGAAAPLRAVLCGGLAGGWVDSSEAAMITLDNRALSKRGLGLGAGTLLLLPEHACGLAETARMLRFLAAEAAGQCGPCRHGLPAIADCFEETLRGHRGARGSKRLLELAALIDRRGACSHPDGSARLLRSALRVFARELEWHARNGLCPGCEAEPILQLRPARAPRALAISGAREGARSLR